MATGTKEVALPGLNVDGILKADELNAIDSYAAALLALGIESVDAATEKELAWDTNPFEPIDKSQAINIPHLIVQWRFSAGDYGEFVIVYAIARLDNGTDWQILYADGGKGIYEQLKSLTDQRIADGHPHPQGGALVRGGLAPSDYTFTDDEGKERPARTYYLSNSRKKAA